MAENRYALTYAGESSNASGGLTLPDNLGKPLQDLNLTLALASVDIRLLTQEQIKLRELLVSQRSLFKVVAAAPAANSEPKSKLKAEVEQRSPPKAMQATMAQQTSLSELNRVLKLDKDQLQALSQETLRMASEKQVAPSGATGVDLLQVQLAAAKSGVGEGLQPELKVAALTDFARDAAINASAFGVDVKTASEMMLAWQSAMNLDRGKSQTLADATNYLGHSTLDATSADIGSVVQNVGEKAVAGGLTPEQVAALAAAFLNSGVDKSAAGAGLNSLMTVLAKADTTTDEQRTAWASLGNGLGPEAVATGMKTDASATIIKVMEALKDKKPEEKEALTKTLFSGNDAILKLLKKPEDVTKAFGLLTVPNPQAPSKLDYAGSVAKDAEQLGGTSQGRVNALDASVTRLSTAAGGALTNAFDVVVVSLDAVASGMARFAEEQPRATAALLMLGGVIALSRGAQIKAATTSIIRGAATKLLTTAGAGPLIDVLDRSADADDTDKPDKSRKSGKSGKRRKPANSKAPVKRSSVAPRTPAQPRPTLRSRLTDAKTLAKGFSKTNALLTVATAAPDVIKGLQEGDNKLVGGALGSAGGSLAGGYAGAVAGAMIGSFIPVIGTAIGGVVGGIVGSTMGSMGGSWLGEKLAPASDKLAPPADVAKELPSAQTQNQQVSFSPLIQVTCPAPDTAEQIRTIIGQQLSGQFHGQFLPLLTNNPLATRRDAALTDGAA
ncbi:phage tail tape measure protein [Pseudomonas fluorescens]|uniref:Phage tail tape measure protein n=1 Tax=Pseudomonas fluorescens TaxID=294 RepID=A0A423P1Y4_PSEFL|nr:phage tail tape measure protein [Pseudomonas fluorescens]ROO04946.1 phage tail tape measure protein [Pseudomonas fluorescens]